MFGIRIYLFCAQGSITYPCLCPTPNSLRHTPIFCEAFSDLKLCARRKRSAKGAKQLMKSTPDLTVYSLEQITILNHVAITCQNNKTNLCQGKTLEPWLWALRRHWSRPRRWRWQSSRPSKRSCGTARSLHPKRLRRFSEENLILFFYEMTHLFSFQLVQE